MLTVKDPHETWRTELLTPVALVCGSPGLTSTFEDLPSRWRDAPVRTLRCAEADGSWAVLVTVVRGYRQQAGDSLVGNEFGRDPHTAYDLGSPGDLVYELQVTEDDGSDEPELLAFRLFGDPQAAGAEVLRWAGRKAACSVSPSVERAEARQRRDRRQFDNRQASAASPPVRFGAVSDEAAADLDALDLSALCWHFPRGNTGAYLRSAVVALAGYGEQRPHLRGRWLTARVEGEELVIGIDDLIPANQRHRWDNARWLWDRRAANTPAGLRWQVDRVEQAAPAVAAVRRGALPEALLNAGVETDPELDALLTGVPYRLSDAELTPTWVANLYRGLADLAPWRLDAAYRGWRDARQAQGLPVRDPVVLFGLGGVGAARKPKLALDHTGDAPLLCLVHTGSSAVLPYAHWTVPADLAAHLHGWQPSLPYPR
ncbi:hypothetical protein [Micromonospora hortensis]|uniref:hypothetical protein n=1 Tax=Micromonospora hortensis TaxID=2911209 RepID=UPI001EE7971B|nr:hypothetical protein [Micromonospora hortensis]MCG5451073.1 hypothetical protein [Micromonospora hortensis]